MHTISNAQIKTIRSLQQKKYRERYAQFVVEGTKSVLEFIQSDYKCRGVFAKEEWYADYLPKITSFDIDLHQANNKQLSQISALKNPQQVLAVFEIDKSQQIDTSASLIMVLDDIRDPGNLGTIIRTADWFGLEQIVCSTTCADCYNPKVIQASMGSMSRMQLIYTDLQDFVQQNKDFDLVLADLDGDNVNQFNWSEKSILLIGNEANGVNTAFYDAPHHKITIPKKGKAESLNAAISAGIILGCR